MRTIFLFQIHYSALYGQILVLTGNCNYFGNWDVNKGFKMKWTQVRIF